MGNSARNFGLAALSWMMISATAWAGKLTLSPSSDGTLAVTNAQTPNPTHTLTLGGPTLSAFSDDQYGDYTELALKFALSSLPVGSQITSATLSFTVTEALPGTVVPPPAPSLSVNGFASSDPTLSAPDFSASPMIPIGTTGPLPLCTVNQTFTLDVTSFLQSLEAGGVTIAGFLGYVPAGGLGTNVTIDGYNPSIPATNQPFITLDYATVPEPSSLILLSIASLIGVSYMKRSSETMHAAQQQA